MVIVVVRVKVIVVVRLVVIVTPTSVVMVVALSRVWKTHRKWRDVRAVQWVGIST